MSAAQEADLRKLVAEGKIDPAMRRYCEVTGHTFARAALWANAVAESMYSALQQGRAGGT